MATNTPDAASADEIEALLAGCARGEQPAFATLYRTTSPQLFAVVLRIVRSRAVAEETLQDVYFRIWQRAGDYRPSRGRPMTWLISIARNGAIDTVRRARPEIGFDDSSATEPESEQPGPATRAGLAEDMEALENCLSQLSELQRRCIVMAYLRGFDYQRISARLAAPLNTIKSWMRRGTLALRACLEA